MLHVFIRLLVVVFSFLLASRVVPGITIDSLTTAAIAAVVFGVLNITVRPIILFFTLPVTILTLGLFIFILNALMFWAAAAIVPGFAIDGFVEALLGSLVVSVVSILVNRVVK